MIGTLLLAAALSAPPAPPPSPLTEKITLELKDASLTDTLEKLAVLIDATPIFEPGIEGSVTLSVKETSIAEILRRLEKEHPIRIRVSTTERWRPDGASTVERRLLVTHGASAPRERAAAPPATSAEPAGSFEFRTARGVAAAWRASPAVTRVELPGCDTPLRIAMLRGDDGGRLVIADGSGHARIVRPSGPGSPAPGFTLSGCGEPLTLVRVEGPGPAAPAPKAVSGALVDLRLRLLEVGRENEDVLSEPRVVVPEGESFQIRSGTGGPGGETVVNIDIRGLVLQVTAADALVALSVTVDREIEPGKGAIRVTQSDQTLRIALAKPVRVTLSSTYGLGRSALVAEMTVTRKERPSGR